MFPETFSELLGNNFIPLGTNRAFLLAETDRIVSEKQTIQWEREKFNTNFMKNINIS